MVKIIYEKVVASLPSYLVYQFILFHSVEVYLYIMSLILDYRKYEYIQFLHRTSKPLQSSQMHQGPEKNITFHAKINFNEPTQSPEPSRDEEPANTVDDIANKPLLKRLR